MIPAPVRRAANDEIAVAVAGIDFPGLRVFLACGDDSRGIGQARSNRRRSRRAPRAIAGT